MGCGKQSNAEINFENSGKTRFSFKLREIVSKILSFNLWGFNSPPLCGG
jgi:hypothetical protein